MSAQDTIATLHRFIEHAPPDPGPLADDIAGWRTPDGVYACAWCAGRIMSRGCRIPDKSAPVWKDEETADVCCCCGDSQHKPSE